MSDTLVLMLGESAHWLRVSGGAIVARGEGVATAQADDRVVAVVPADDLTIHHAELPDLSEPQANAAARLLVAGQSASAADTLHVAVGRPDGTGDRPVVAIDRGRFASLLADLAGQGHDPDAVVAASMLLVRPAAGYVRGTIGAETILRGADGAFADDPVLTPLLTDGAITTLDRAALETGLVAGVTNPEVDLRQGLFAKRRVWGIDWVRLRRIGRIALCVAAATLLFHIVELVRLRMAATRLEANSIVVARAALPPGTNINNPLFQVQDQLNGLRGPGGGMLPLAAAVATAVQATPNVELTAMIFDGGGTLRITARAPTVADLSALETRLTAAGLTAAAGPALVDQGRQIRDYTVSVR